MNKFLTSAAAVALLAGAAGAARAADDDSATINGITFYGIVDVGISYQTHSAPVNDYGSVGSTYLVQKEGNRAGFNMVQSGMSQSRVGLKGATDLGDGWTGIFKLETGINPTGGNITNGIGSVAQQNGKALAQQNAAADSSQAGQAFNRAAYVGISNDKFGTMTFGRQTTLTADTVGAYDPMYSSYAFALIGFSGTAQGGGGTESARWDNTVKYLYHYGPMRVGANYQFAGELGRNDTGVGGDVGFDYAGFSIDATAEHKKDAIAAGALGAGATISAALAAGYDITHSIAATVSDNTEYGIMAKYKFGQFQAFLGYEYIKLANPSSPLLAGSIDQGGYIMATVNNTKYTHNAELNYYWAGVRYDMTPKLQLVGAVYHQTQNSYTGNGCSDTSNGACSGDENTFSLMADYHFTKKFDVYGGLEYSQVLNGIANGYLHNNNIDPTVGVRYTF